MKYIITLILFLVSCTPSLNQSNTFIIKYGSQEVKSAEFINTLMILGFTKHGESFYSRIYDPTFFEKIRVETLEQIINNIFFGSLSQKHKIKITDSDLEKWIKERTPDIQTEDLVYNLKANNLSYADWKGLFRNQLIKKKIIEKLNGNKKQVPIVERKSSDDGLLLAVISFDDELQANEAYNNIFKNKARFDDVLKKINGTSKYSWVKNKDINFYKNIKKLPLKRSSKPIETPWGYSLVRIKKKGKTPFIVKNTTPHEGSAAVQSLLEKFKKDPKLSINTDLLYSLKIKK